MIANSSIVETKDYSDDRLGINFTTARPISADDLADAFKGMSALFKREVMKNATADQLEASEFSLYVTKIETNCILTELAAYIGSSLPGIQLMSHAVTIHDFIVKTKALGYWFIGRSVADNGSPLEIPTITEAKDFNKMLKAAGDGGLTMTRKLYRDGGSHSVEEHFSFTPSEVLIAQSGAERFIQTHNQKEEADYKMVSLYLTRIDKDHHVAGGRSPEKGVIESISNRKLPVHWVSDLDSKRVKSIQQANLFDVIFTVDVKVDYAKGKPSAYRILQLHEVYLPDDEE